MSRTVYYDWQGNEVKPPKAAPVPMTNADRIRAMTDEELADIMGPYECVGCPVETENGECLQEGENCHKALLRWLKSPVEEEQT